MTERHIAGLPPSNRTIDVLDARRMLAIVGAADECTLKGGLLVRWKDYTGYLRDPVAAAG